MSSLISAYKSTNLWNLSKNSRKNQHFVIMIKHFIMLGKKRYIFQGWRQCKVEIWCSFSMLFGMIFESYNHLQRASYKCSALSALVVYNSTSQTILCSKLILVFLLVLSVTSMHVRRIEKRLGPSGIAANPLEGN